VAGKAKPTDRPAPVPHQTAQQWQSQNPFHAKPPSDLIQRRVIASAAQWANAPYMPVGL
jgi:hypothetical protein